LRRICVKAFNLPRPPTRASDGIVSSTEGKRPLSTLQRCTKKRVTVRLKNETEYQGRMDSVDTYMNLIMTDARELREGRPVANYARAILRGNNVLFIKLEKDL